MKIGEEAYVHGYIDEIRNGVIIIRNKGGYFGTEPEEVFPSAQPERKKGKWIVCGDKHVCSECDEFALCDAYDVLETGEYQEELSNFCPNCGADMRGEKEETE